MISSDAEKERFVLPQWLPFKAALSQQELFSSNVGEGFVDTRASEIAFAEGLASFQATPGPFLACDLLGVALRLGKREPARALAEYVVQHPLVGPVATRIALETLGKTSKSPASDATLPARIREARAWIRRFPMDAIAWVEHARLYTIIGQKRRAQQAIERALVLAPLDRFVVRAAVRFFTHRDNWERAHQVAGNAARATSDPWLIALWISTGSQLGKVPATFKSHFAAAMVAPDQFHYSELLEACATQEVLAGSDKKAKRAFKQAWIEPPKTVVTHSQWVLREKMPELATTTSVDFSRSSEAMAWVRLMRLELTQAVESAREWALEEPFSTKPFMHGSFVDTLREKYEEAEALAREGLRANPGHHGLTNNLAFALVGQDRLPEAVALLEPLRSDFEETKDVALIATWGLVRMKQGAHAEGRQFYLRAIERAKEGKDPRLTLRAVLNYLTAEIDTGGVVDPELLVSASDALTKTTDARIIATAETLEKRLSVNQSLFPNEKEKAAVMRFERAVAESRSELAKMVLAANQSRKETHISG